MVLGRRVPRRRQPARPARPRPDAPTVAGPRRGTGSVSGTRRRPPARHRAHRDHPVEARVRRGPAAAHRRLRAGRTARRGDLGEPGQRAHARRPLRLAGAGARHGGRRQDRRLRVVAVADRGGHGRGAVRRRLDELDARAAGRQADAGVGRPRLARRRARARRPSGQRGSFHGRRVRTGPGAGRGEVAATRADPADRDGPLHAGAGPSARGSDGRARAARTGRATTAGDRPDRTRTGRNRPGRARTTGRSTRPSR